MLDVGDCPDSAARTRKRPFVTPDSGNRSNGFVELFKTRTVEVAMKAAVSYPR